MERKVRVVDGPLPTDEEGREIHVSATWFSDSVASQRYYDPALVNGTRPTSTTREAAYRRVLLARADEVLERNSKLFRDLA